MKGHEPNSFGNFPWIFGDAVYHYTCNPPKQNILDNYEIKSRGKDVGCADPREVLEIPRHLLEIKGIDISNEKAIAVLNLEKMLVNLN